jgi:hypothetical protein
MAKIIVQTDSGEDIRAIMASDHKLRNCSYSLLSFLGLLTEIIKALEEALDKDNSA